MLSFSLLRHLRFILEDVTSYWASPKLPPNCSFAQGASLGTPWMTVDTALFKSLGLLGGPLKQFNKPNGKVTMVLVNSKSSMTSMTGLQLLVCDIGLEGVLGGFADICAEKVLGQKLIYTLE